MGVKCTTPKEQIAKEISEATQRYKKALIYNLSYCGEACVKRARAGHSMGEHTDATYQDRTGNLTSSIGYCVSIDGNIVNMSGFETVGTEGKGTSDGKSYIKKLAAQYPNKVALIVVAGMEYASYVKNMGYDVIDGAELLAENIVPRLLKQIGY